jgi:hypothetical protein
MSKREMNHIEFVLGPPDIGTIKRALELYKEKTENEIKANKDTPRITEEMEDEQAEEVRKHGGDGPFIVDGLRYDLKMADSLLETFGRARERIFELANTDSYFFLRCNEELASRAALDELDNKMYDENKRLR